MRKAPEELTLPRSVAHPGFLLLTRSSLAKLDRAPEDMDAVRHVLDTMGKRSMVAQGENVLGFRVMEQDVAIKLTHLRRDWIRKGLSTVSN